MFDQIHIQEFVDKIIYEYIPNKTAGNRKTRNFIKKFIQGVGFRSGAYFSTVKLPWIVAQPKTLSLTEKLWTTTRTYISQPQQPFLLVDIVTIKIVRDIFLPYWMIVIRGIVGGKVVYFPIAPQLFEEIDMEYFKHVMIRI